MPGAATVHKYLQMTQHMRESLCEQPGMTKMQAFTVCWHSVRWAPENLLVPLGTLCVEMDVSKPSRGCSHPSPKLYKAEANHYRSPPPPPRALWGASFVFHVYIGSTRAGLGVLDSMFSSKLGPTSPSDAQAAWPVDQVDEISILQQNQTGVITTQIVHRPPTWCNRLGQLAFAAMLSHFAVCTK